MEAKKLQQMFDSKREGMLSRLAVQKWRQRAGIINRFDTLRFRECFLKWKRKAECEEIVIFTNDFGAARQQLNLSKRNVNNMKNFLINEGYTNKELQKITEAQQLNYKQNVEKVLCRLYTYGESRHNGSDIYLLPWCLDKLKQYVRERKAFGYWIQNIESRKIPNRMELRNAFEYWANHTPKKIAYLKQQKYIQLASRDKENITQKQDQALILNETQNTINELKDQRTFLIKKVISAQRLALDRCNFSYKFAKEKAWVKFVANTKRAMQNSFNYATSTNLELKDKLKEKLIFLENQNMILAKENDDLKQGTNQSVNLIATADQIQQELEFLSQNLADKAIQIRKLLEENNRLNSQLVQINE